MRTFSAEYLRRTRRGMWEDSRSALADLRLDSRERVLDVGCGTGVLTRVLAEETDGAVVGVDADLDLLSIARKNGSEVLAGDALRLPFRDDSFDLVVCQALLINLPDPTRALAEFARVSADLVAAIEPDNDAVQVDSTVAAEASVERRARNAYLAGIDVDGTLGGGKTRRLFEDAGLSDVTTTRYPFVKATEPPYSADALADARRKASGTELANHRATLLDGDLSVEEYEVLRGDWRATGREVIAQMQEGAYRRRELVPFSVTVGRP